LNRTQSAEIGGLFGGSLGSIRKVRAGFFALNFFLMTSSRFTWVPVANPAPLSSQVKHQQAARNPDHLEEK
jgi:hypothetical protein